VYGFMSHPPLSRHARATSELIRFAPYDTSVIEACADGGQRTVVHDNRVRPSPKATALASLFSTLQAVRNASKIAFREVATHFSLCEVFHPAMVSAQGPGDVKHTVADRQPPL